MTLQASKQGLLPAAMRAFTWWRGLHLSSSPSDSASAARRTGRVRPGPRPLASGACSALAAAVLGAGLSLGLMAEASAQATLSISASSDSAPEGDDGMQTVEYTVTLSEAISQFVVYKVCFDVENVPSIATLDTSGSSEFVDGKDYRIRQGTLRTSNCTGNNSFTSTSSSLEKTAFVIEVRGDEVKEEDETITATLEIINNPDGVVLDNDASSHVYRILNDDTADGDGELVIQPSTLMIREGESGTFSIRLSKQPTGTRFGLDRSLTRISFPQLDTASDTTNTYAYFPSSENRRLIMTPPRQSISKTAWRNAYDFTIFALDDGKAGNETITLRVLGDQGGLCLDSCNFQDVTDSIELTIIDAPPPETVPEVGITPLEELIDEADDARFRIERTGATTSSLTVVVEVSQDRKGSAGKVIEVSQRGTKTVTIPAGASHVDYAIPTSDDTQDEGEGDVKVAIKPFSLYSIDDNAGEAVVSVEDDDGDIIVRIEAGPSPVTEGEGATFTITRSDGSRDAALVVRLGVEEKNTNGWDFVAASDEGTDKTVTIPANRRSATYTVPTEDDQTEEPDGPVSVWVRPGTGYVRHGSLMETTVTVKDNDNASAPTVANAIPDRTATVGTAFSYSFPEDTFSDPDGDAMTYTATRGDDSPLPSWLSFDAGTRTFSGTPASGDAGTLTVKVTADDGNGGTASDEFDIVVSDGATTPTVSFASAASSAGEGAGTRNVTFSLAPAPAEDITVVLRRSGTASEGLDYSPLGAAVSVTAGTTSVNVRVAIIDDSQDESNETVILTLTAGTGYTVGSENVHTLTINDNDDPPPDTPVVSISAGAEITEGQDAEFTLTASPAPTGNISVAVTVTDSGNFATGGTGAQTVTVGTSGTATLTVATDDDDTDEPNGRITATVGSGTGYSAHNTNGSASVSVNDNDQTVSSISVADASASEGRAVVFRVAVSPAHAQEMTLDWDLSDNTTSTDDFRNGSASGTVTVTANSGSATFSVATADDRIDEGDETFTVTLSGLPANAEFSDDTATGTIVDDDTAGLVLSSLSPRLAEEGDEGTYRVKLNSEPTDDVTVTVESDSTAVAVSPESLTFTAESWSTEQTVTVTAMAERGTVSITHAVSSPDPKYAGLTGPVNRPLVVRIGQDPAEASSAWLVRFGRTVASQVLDAVRDRTDRMGRPGSGTNGTVVGAPLPSGPASPAPSREDGSSSFRDAAAGLDRSLDWRELATGTSFDMSGETVSGERYSIWGRGSHDRFDGSLDGSAGAISLSGETTTLMAGGDTERTTSSGRMLLGAMMAHSRTRGSFSDFGPGSTRKIDADMTSVVPYGALDLGSGLRIWGSLGAGVGDIRIGSPDGAGPGHGASDMEWLMAGAGFRRSLRGTGDGMGLWIRGDVRYSRTSADLFSASLSGSARQAGIGLGGEWPAMPLGSKWNPESAGQGETTWRPRWSLGLRHDGGDAEEGLGVEIGVGVDWRFADGLEVGVDARGLATHEDDDFRDQGVSVVLEYDPRPDTARGFSGRFGLDVGNGSSDPDAGLEHLLGNDAFPAESEAPQAATGWRAEGAWGLYRHRRGLLGSPYLSLSGSGRIDATRMGYRMSPEAVGSPDLEVDLFMGIRTSDDDRPDSLGGGLELRLRW